MMNNNHKNSGCGSGDELVSYLYGETSAAENAAFEKHLAGCAVCADELEAFSGVHFSIDDWKARDFLSLQTPTIEIPYPAAPQRHESLSAKNSWLTALRELFSPKWSLAAASFAIIAVCVGIAFYASNSPSGNYVAGTNKNAKIQVSPTAEKSPEAPTANIAPRDLPNPEATQPAKPLDKPQPQLAVENDAKNKRPLKAANTPRPVQKAETTNLPKTSDAKRNTKNKEEIPPKIYDEEEEDDTLRLAELFEEIDTVE